MGVVEGGRLPTFARTRGERKVRQQQPTWLCLLYLCQSMADGENGVSQPGGKKLQSLPAS